MFMSFLKFSDALLAPDLASAAEQEQGRRGVIALLNSPLVLPSLNRLPPS
jgi:hypothetical protein